MALWVTRASRRSTSMHFSSGEHMPRGLLSGKVHFIHRAHNRQIPPQFGQLIRQVRNYITIAINTTTTTTVAAVAATISSSASTSSCSSSSSSSSSSVVFVVVVTALLLLVISCRTELVDVTGLFTPCIRFDVTLTFLKFFMGLSISSTKLRNSFSIKSFSTVHPSSYHLYSLGIDSVVKLTPREIAIIQSPTSVLPQDLSGLHQRPLGKLPHIRQL
jgi:hypothetical protein